MKDPVKDDGPEAAAEPAEVDGAALVEALLAEAPLVLAPEPALFTMGPQAAPNPGPAEPALVAPSAPVDGVVIGVVVGFAPSGAALVDFDGNPSPEPLEARSLVTLRDSEIAREVALLFEGGDRKKPMVMGVVQQLAQPARATPSPEVALTLASEAGTPVEVERDRERVVIEAQQEIVLRCGDASITLTRAGKILIKGAYVLARATGVNRIQGGSVQIN